MAKPLAKLATLGVGLALASAACVVNSTDVPSLTGPSEMGLSFGLTASPDTITQDGASQSRIVLSAFDPSGKPAPGVAFRLDLIVDGAFSEFGTLSARTLLTGSDGKATAVYTAPPVMPKYGFFDLCSPSLFTYALPNNCVKVIATSVGTGYTSGNINKTVDVHLVPPASTRNPDAPVANFVYAPSFPAVGQEINFNGNPSAAIAGRILIRWDWNWGDGTTATQGNPIEDHDYAFAGNYPVTLTVYDNFGAFSSSTRYLSIR
jgi:PKD domain